MKVKTVNSICENLPPMSGAEKVIKELKKLDYKVICFSGGFKNATIPFMNKYGLDAEFSNILHEKDGILTGLVGGEMMFSSSKGAMLQTLQRLLKIPVSDTIVIGDGANDISMFEHAGKKIAFCAKPILKSHADVIIEVKDLTAVLDCI